MEEWPVNESNVEPLNYSYFDGFATDGWGFNQTITIKLDCDDWIVSYFKGERFIRNGKIKPDQLFWLILLCGDPIETCMEIVESPLSIMNL